MGAGTGVEQYKWFISINTCGGKQSWYCCPGLLRYRYRKLPIIGDKPQLLDQAQISLRLVQLIGCTLQFGRQGATRKLLRFSSTQWNACQVADIARNVRRLAE